MHIIKRDRNFAYPEYKPQYPKDPNYKIENMRLYLKVYVFEKKIEGRAELDILLKDKVSSIDLDAVDMIIKRVSVDGRDTDFYYDGEKLKVLLTEEHSHLTLTIEYEAYPKKGLYFVLPSKEKPNIIPQVWSQGETEYNKYWFPTFDYPNMKIKSEVVLEVPKGSIGLSNGKLIRHEEKENWSIWHWKMDKPHTVYLVAVAIGQFDFKTDDYNGIPLAYYVPKGMGDLIENSFDKTKDMMKFFEEFIGVKYPWDKYYQVCVSEYMYGGMENTTLTILTDYTLHDDLAHEEYDSYSLVAHELAHQWFGDLVTTKDWANIWLNESFATYLEALYIKHLRGGDEFIENLLRKLETYLLEYNSKYARPIAYRLYKYSEEMFDRHSYQKGALVLHTLKNIVGEEKFREILKEFLERYKFSNADTEDFRKVVEEVVGRDMEWFFDQFIYNAGHPILTISYSWDPGEKVVKIKVKQSQKEDSWEAYRLPLDVEVVTEKRRIRKTLWISEREEVFYIFVDGKPEAVYFDPEFKIFTVLDVKNKIDEWIKWLKSEYTYMRLLATKKLGDEKSKRVVDALRDALLDDPFWGVRARAAEALGKIGTEEAKKALLEALEKVKIKKVKMSIAKALGNFKKDEDVFRALKSVLGNHNEGYYTRAEAANSLGRIKDERALPLLKKALEVKSHAEIIKRGAIKGLAELGTDEAFSLIKKCLSKSEDNLVRATAVMALAEFPDKKEIFELLKEASKDENYRVRFAVVSAIGKLLSAKYLPILEEMIRSDLDNRVRREARDVSEKIRKFMERPEEYKKLREEIDKLKELQRSLVEKVEKLKSRY